MDEFVFQSESLADTDRLGTALGELVRPGTTIALCGTLGAGKTRLVQALAMAYGVEEEDVTSPTFVLCQHYHGSRTIHHLDAYRIQDDDEFLELGVDEYFDGDDVTVIEWADRVAACLPKDRLEIEIQVVADTGRKIFIRSSGKQGASLVREIAERLAV